MQSLDLSRGRWLRLSHVLSPATPSYGGSERFVVEPTRSLLHGDSCNTVALAFSNHLGSHVDAPRHFFAEGKSVDDYAIDEWVFSRPWIAEVQAAPGEILGVERIESALVSCADADLLLVRTGFERLRGDERYWSESPAFDPELADYLHRRLPSLSAIGLDTISISSYRRRELGRLAHRAFLGRGIRIFEDLALAALPPIGLERVIALPLLFDNADGAPCTVAGFVSG